MTSDRSQNSCRTGSAASTGSTSSTEIVSDSALSEAAQRSGSSQTASAPPGSPPQSASRIHGRVARPAASPQWTPGAAPQPARPYSVSTYPVPISVANPFPGAPTARGIGLHRQRQNLSTLAPRAPLLHPQRTCASSHLYNTPGQTARPASLLRTFSIASVQRHRPRRYGRSLAIASKQSTSRQDHGPQSECLYPPDPSGYPVPSQALMV